MSDFTKGEWKPKKIALDEHTLYFVWAQEGELSLDSTKNKDPKVLVSCMHLPNTDLNTELVTDEKEMEANIILMASSKKLLESLLSLIESINPKDVCRGKFSHLNTKYANDIYVGAKTMPSDEAIFKAIEAIREATTIKFK
jgi:hypothetical protein